MSFIRNSWRLTLCAAFVFAGAAVCAGFARADAVGQRATFFVNPTFDATARTSISATLEYAGAHAYYYADDAYLSTLNPNALAALNQEIVALSQEFDANIYPKETAFWGSEPNPGIDNDPKITILLEQLPNGTGGYFDSANGYPVSEVKDSNQREMLTINIRSLSTDQADVFLAHEVQHLISFNQKELMHNVSEDTWLNELRSQYSITVAGYNGNFPTSDLLQRAQTFLNDPTDSMMEWPNVNLDYASVTLFGQYLVDRFGPGILQDTLHSASVGIASFDQWLEQHGSSENFAAVFADWEWADYWNNRTTNIAYGYANPNLQTLHVATTDSHQLSATMPVTATYSLKPWQPDWSLFRGDPAASGKNVKITWQGSGFNVYYADSSGNERQIGNGDILPAPVTTSNFLLLPLSVYKTTDFGPTETPSTLAVTVQYADETAGPAVPPIHDGSLIMHAGAPDIYVIWGHYKRYLAPAVLPFYGLDPKTAVTVPESVFNSYDVSNYIRDVNEKKVYAVWPDGTKHWLNMSAQQFTDSHRDWNSIFIINDLESNYYKIGTNITE